MTQSPFDRAAAAVDAILAGPQPTNGSVIVHAVLEALREPSEALITAMSETVPAHGYEWDFAEWRAEEHWQAMIDAILADALIRIPRLDAQPRNNDAQN